MISYGTEVSQRTDIPSEIRWWQYKNLLRKASQRKKTQGKKERKKSYNHQKHRDLHYITKWVEDYGQQ